MSGRLQPITSSSCIYRIWTNDINRYNLSTWISQLYGSTCNTYKGDLFGFGIPVLILAAHQVLFSYQLDHFFFSASIDHLQRTYKDCDPSKALNCCFNTERLQSWLMSCRSKYVFDNFGSLPFVRITSKMKTSIIPARQEVARVPIDTKRGERRGVTGGSELISKAK